MKNRTLGLRRQSCMAGSKQRNAVWNHNGPPSQPCLLWSQTLFSVSAKLAAQGEDAPVGGRTSSAQSCASAVIVKTFQRLNKTRTLVKSQTSQNQTILILISNSLVLNHTYLKMLFFFIENTLKYLKMSLLITFDLYNVTFYV